MLRACLYIGETNKSTHLGCQAGVLEGRVMLLKAIYIQLLVLGLVLIWFALCQRRSRNDLIFKTLAVAALLVGLWQGSVWVYPPYWGLIILALIFILIAIWKSYRPVHNTALWRSTLSNIPPVLMMIVGGFLGFFGLMGHGQNPAGQVAYLTSPIGPDDGACVLSGGLNGLVNQHIFESEAPQDIGQKFALDIIGSDLYGFRVRQRDRLNPKPSELESYLAYGMPVYAPCDGRVIWAVGNQPDQPIGQKNRVNGNAVVLACADAHIWMAHLQPDSLAVSKGQQVEAGKFVARIGNSGHSEEPHLHLHAETIVKRGDPWTHGEPVHMRINGKLMAHGDCF